MLQRNKLFGLGSNVQSQIQTTKQLTLHEKDKGFHSIHNMKEATSILIARPTNKEEFRSENIEEENSQSTIMQGSKNEASNTQNDDKFSDVDFFLEEDKWQDSSIGEHNKKEVKKSEELSKSTKLSQEYGTHLKTLQDKLKEAEKKNANLQAIKNTLQKECTYLYDSLVFQAKEEKVLKQYNDSVKEVKDEHERLVNKIRAEHENIMKLIEADIKEELSLIRKSQAQERKVIESIQQREFEIIRQQHEEDIKILNKKMMYEQEALKDQLQYEEALSKLTDQVENLMTTMQGRMTSKYNSDVEALVLKEKEQSDYGNNIDLIKANLNKQRVQAENMKESSKKDEEVLKQMMEKRKRINEDNEKEVSEYCKTLLEEITEKKEQLAQNKARLAAERQSLEKEEQKWKAQQTEDQMIISLRKRKLESRKQEFEESMQANGEDMSLRIIELNEMIEGVNRQLLQVNRDKQEQLQKEIELKLSADDLELRLKNISYAKNRLEIDKARIQGLAAEVEKESKVISKLKDTIDTTKSELNQMDNDVETKAIELKTRITKHIQAEGEQDAKTAKLQGLDSKGQPISKRDEDLKLELKQKVALVRKKHKFNKRSNLNKVLHAPT